MKQGYPTDDMISLEYSNHDLPQLIKDGVDHLKRIVPSHDDLRERRWACYAPNSLTALHHSELPSGR